MWLQKRKLLLSFSPTKQMQSLISTHGKHTFQSLSSCLFLTAQCNCKPKPPIQPFPNSSLPPPPNPENIQQFPDTLWSCWSGVKADLQNQGKQEVIKITYLTGFFACCLKNCKQLKPQVNAAQPLHTHMHTTFSKTQWSCRNSINWYLWGPKCFNSSTANTQCLWKKSQLSTFLETELQYWL